MLLLFIVLPCTLVGIAGVVLLDRVGGLPRLDHHGPVPRAPGNTIARPLSLGVIVMLGTWILAWLVVLIVGLNLILSSG